MKTGDYINRVSILCPHCGEVRKRNGRGYYEICGCEEAQKEVETARARFEEIHELEDELQYRQNLISSYRKRAEMMMDDSGLGRRFSDRTFENFKVSEENRKAHDACMNFAKNFTDTVTIQKGIILSGPPGTGKTHLAAAITHYIVRVHGLPVKFVSSIGMFEDLKEFSRKDILTLKKVPLLVIDDLGKEKITDWNREKLYEIINARYEDYLPVVITTNLAPAAFDKELGPAVVSRLHEMCSGISLTGKDRRRK